MGTLCVIASAPIAFAAGLILIGVGILNFNQLSWKMLFFSLIVFIVNVAAVILIALFCLLVYPNVFYKFYQGIPVNPVTWFSFLSIFLSGIIVLYYLTRREVVHYFGHMKNLLDPF